MRTARLLSVALLATSATAALVACNPEVPRAKFSYAEKRGRLDSNGLRFVVIPDDTTSLVEVDVRYEVGSREDPPGKAGLAHLVEHMMFQHKPDGPDTAPMMHAIGQLTTFFNAYTNWDTTHYMMQSRAEQLDALLKIESMRLFFRCQTISEDEFLREREVVRNEIRQRGGTPEGRIPDLILSEIYPKDHPYARMIGGDDSNLTNITLKDVCDFMDKYYTPDRATVIVAGGVDVDKTADLIVKWFGPIAKRPGGPRAVVKPVTSVSKGRADYELDMERSYAVVAWPMPPSNTPEGRAAQWGLGRVFGETAQKASQYDFAYSVDGTWLGGQEAPAFAVIIELKGADMLGEAIEFVKKAANKAHRNFDDANWQDTEDFKARSSAGFLQGLEPLMSRTNAVGDAVQFDQETEFDSQQEYLLAELKRIQTFDGAFIGRSVKKTLDWDNAKVILFKAKAGGIKGDKRSKVKFETKSHDKREVPEVNPKEARVPLKVAAEVSTFDGAERYTMNNGMRVVLLSVPSPLPLMTVQLQFDVGDVHSGIPGRADLAATFLHPPLDMDALQRIGVGVNGFTNADSTSFVASGLNVYSSDIIKGLERTIKAGDYNQEMIENWQKRVREQFRRKDYQAQVEYQRQILAAIYGPDHPYTQQGLLTPDSANKIGHDNLVSFKEDHYSAANATIIVVGNFDVPAVKRAISDTFGYWGRGSADKAVEAAPRARTGPEYIGVIGPTENPQVSVTIAYPAPAGVDGQEAARRVLTGMLNERMGDIRFKLGSTYGTYAGRQVQVAAGAYQMGGDVDGLRAGESLKAMRDGIEVLRKGGATFDIDFVRARRALIEDLLGQSTMTFQLASQLAGMARFKLKPDYYKQLVKQIAAVSPAQVKMLLANELDPKNEVIVGFGDRAALEKMFDDAGLTQVKLIEPDYK